MSPRHGNLADPDYEPTDEELQELSRSAFADVPAKNAEALRKVHARIAELRAGLTQQLEELVAKERAESAK
ncbi:MAG: hypothetical protein ABW061_01235 [Polyangiaceae bacterium]